MNTNKKLDNKGFSLVELIIVIAIMAILVGVVGTQVIPYIEKSRQGKDQQLLSAYCTDTVAAASTVAAQLNPSANYTFEVTVGSSTVTVSNNGGDAAGATAIKNELETLRGNTALKWESKAAGSNKIVITYNQSGANPGCVASIDSCTKIAPVSSK